jgi:hypothetical protein
MTARITPFPISKADPMEAFREVEKTQQAAAEQFIRDLIVNAEWLAASCAEALSEPRVRAIMSPAEIDAATQWAKIAADVERLKWTPKGSR